MERLMLRTTWADKSAQTRQQLVRERWTTLLFTDPVRAVVNASQLPTVGTEEDHRYMDFLLQLYTGLDEGAILNPSAPPFLQRVAAGVRPEMFEWRWCLHDASMAGGIDYTGYGEAEVSQLVRKTTFTVSGATAMFRQTFTYIPLSVQLRYLGGPPRFMLGNRIIKGWERPA